MFSCLFRQLFSFSLFWGVRVEYYEPAIMDSTRKGGLLLILSRAFDTITFFLSFEIFLFP